MRKINSKEMPQASPVKRPVAPTPISMSLLRVRRPKQSDITFQQRRNVEINEDEMVIFGRDNRVYATSQISNDAWFDKLALDKAIAQALKNSHNLCFIVYGQKGSGKDYCLTGGYL